jgi:hypothetical protein
MVRERWIFLAAAARELGVAEEKGLSGSVG